MDGPKAGEIVGIGTMMTTMKTTGRDEGGAGMRKKITTVKTTSRGAEGGDVKRRTTILRMRHHRERRKKSSMPRRSSLSCRKIKSFLVRSAKNR